MTARLILILVPLAIIAVFLLIRPKMRAMTNFSVDFSSGQNSPGSPAFRESSIVFTTKSVSSATTLSPGEPALPAPLEQTDLSIKCDCGETQRFHTEGSGGFSGSVVFPSGDTYTCPRCGKTHDLAQVRDLARKLGHPF